MGDDAAASGGYGFDGVRLQGPIADVDDVDVLFEKDVAGEVAVPEPVAEALLVGGGVGVIVLDGGRGVVMRGDAGDLAELAVVDAADDFDERRRAADLEAYVDAYFSVGEP